MKKRARAAARSDDRAGRSGLKLRDQSARPRYWARVEAFFERYAAWLAVALVLIGTARIVSTYTVFSHTFDEPGHIACGIDWLEKLTDKHGTLAGPCADPSDQQDPPLPRVMAALLPKMFGAHGWNKKNMWDEGLAILFAQGSEDRMLALARAGILPFFWITCWVTFLCARWISGRPSAVLAVFLVTMTPSILAHSGLATTDMGLTAMLLLGIYMGWRWLEEPVWWRAASFGASTGLAILAKFSTLPFLPSVAVVGLIFWWYLERPSLKAVIALVRERAPQFLMAVLIAVLVVWAGYRFSFGKPPGEAFRVPAPELFGGLQSAINHNKNGHLTYLLGRVNTVGWPYFYLVALSVKLPLAVLGLGVCGLVLLFSRKLFGMRGWLVVSVVLGILIFSSFFTRIIIGTRHVLPVIVALGIAGGCAAVWLLRRFEGHRAGQLAVALVLLSAAVSSAVAHPDYLAYFNFLAGDNPQAFLVDSDLDWGQDTKMLAKRLKELGAREVYFNQFQPGNFEKLYGFPPIRPLDENGPRPGWNAVKITPLRLGLFGNERYVYDRGYQFWPDRIEPTERVGHGILLFYSGSSAR
jgi:Dolichyl-phosphate-mannose-protein mannosyltransferase